MCTKLTEISIPASVTEIGEGAFAGCDSLSVLKIPAGVTEGLADVLEGFDVKDKEIVFPEGSSYKLVDGVLYNGTKLEILLDDSITEVNIPEGVTVIPEKAFYYNSQKGTGPKDLAAVTFPSTLEEIGKSALQKTQLTSVIIPDGVTTIGYAAFGNISTLKTIVIPASVTSIGDYAFSFVDNCEAVTVIRLGETPPTFGSNVFSIGNEPINIDLIVPETARDKYEVALSGVIENIGSDTPAFSLSLDPASLNLLDVETKTVAVTAAVPKGYKLAMTNSDNTVATATLSDDNKTITVKALKNGAATISVSIVSEDGSITLVTKSCSVVVGASYTVTIVYATARLTASCTFPRARALSCPPPRRSPGTSSWAGAALMGRCISRTVWSKSAPTPASRPFGPICPTSPRVRPTSRMLTSSRSLTSPWALGTTTR